MMWRAAEIMRERGMDRRLFVLTLAVGLLVIGAPVARLEAARIEVKSGGGVHASDHSAGGTDAVTATDLASSCTDAQVLGGTAAGTGVECQSEAADVDTKVILDLGDDGGNDSLGLTELAITNDTNAIFSEPSADKLLIDLSKAIPKANDLICTDCINAGEIEDIYLLTVGDAMGGTLDMATNLLTNIGDANTDFVTGGGLTLAGALTANSTAALNGTVTLTPDISEQL